MKQKKKTRFIIVGFGNMGKDWSSILIQNNKVQIVGVVDVIKKSLTEAVTLLKLEKNSVSNSLSDIIARTRPDVVLDTSPPINHSSVSRCAIKMGCNVLGEKPIALNLDEAIDIVKLCRSHKKIYMVNQNYRWNPTFQSLVKIIKSNKLGKIHTISIHYSQNFNFKDTFRYKMDNPLLIDMAVHHFDLVRCLTQSNMDTSYCVEYNVLGSKFKNGSSAFVIFTIKNGIVFNYYGSWGNIGENTSFMGFWKIYTEKATITWDGYNDPIIELIKIGKVYAKNITSKIKFKNDTLESFKYELNSSLDKFLESIQNGKNPETWCGDNIYTLEMVLASIQSSLETRPVRGLNL